MDKCCFSLLLLWNQTKSLKKIAKLSRVLRKPKWNKISNFFFFNGGRDVLTVQSLQVNFSLFNPKSKQITVKAGRSPKCKTVHHWSWALCEGQHHRVAGISSHIGPSLRQICHANLVASLLCLQAAPSCPQGFPQAEALGFGCKVRHCTLLLAVRQLWLLARFRWCYLIR